MKISIVIPSLYYVDGEYLKMCVESLRASGITWNIVVVTNGSSAPPKLNFRGVTRHLHNLKQGQCNAVNIGVGALDIDTDYVMVSNSDMYYAPGWDKNLKFGFDCFSPNLVEPTDNAGSAPPFLKFNGGLTLEAFDKEAVNGFIREEVDKEYSPQEKNETGFNLPFFIKKKLWDVVGGYDEAYDPWSSNSDTDLQTKINLAGVTPMRLRDVLVYHFGSKSGTFDGTHQDFYRNNIEYFRNKFGFDRDELGSDVWRNKDMLPTDPEQIKYHQELYGLR